MLVDLLMMTFILYVGLQVEEVFQISNHNSLVKFSGISKFVNNIRELKEKRYIRSLNL